MTGILLVLQFVFAILITTIVLLQKVRVLVLAHIVAATKVYLGLKDQQDF